MVQEVLTEVDMLLEEVMEVAEEAMEVVVDTEEEVDMAVEVVTDLTIPEEGTLISLSVL